MDLQTGDIIFTSKKSIIVHFMNLFQSDPCIWGHVLLVKDSKTAWEAHWLLREVEIKEVLKKHKYYKVIRKNDLTEEQKQTMREIAPQVMGYPYGVSRIFLQLLDHIFHTNWFTKLDDRVYNQVCSSYVAWVYEVSCRYRFNGVLWESCDPDDIEDDQLDHPELWDVMGERSLRRA